MDPQLAHTTGVVAVRAIGNTIYVRDFVYVRLLFDNIVYTKPPLNGQLIFMGNFSFMSEIHPDFLKFPVAGRTH